jgi:hypothetical protein
MIDIFPMWIVCCSKCETTLRLPTAIGHMVVAADKLEAAREFTSNAGWELTGMRGCLCSKCLTTTKDEVKP